MIDLDAIRSALGNLKPETHPSVARPLHEQIAALLRFATDPKLEPRRTIPVAWDDTDILVCDVIAKLVAEVDRLSNALAGRIIDARTASGLWEALSLAYEAVLGVPPPLDARVGEIATAIATRRHL